MDMGDVLRRYKKGKMNLEEALRHLSFHKIRKIEEFAKIDVYRDRRVGVPEVILAEGKTPQQVVKIVKELGEAIVSRLSKRHIKALQDEFSNVEYNDKARVAIIGKRKTVKVGKVGIITAGTSDIPVAEEAAAVAMAMGCEVFKEYDVGVAALHRLIHPLRRMVEEDVDVVIVAAGREGTLPSVVAGLIDVPVIGLPTSTGYGYGGKGEAALKSMLQSCTFLTVVNIDNGVGAGACAALIARRTRLKRSK